MPTYVLMTKLAPDCLGDANDRRGKGKDWLARVNKACPEVKWIAHYALLGRYDFMDLYEAPDDATAHKVSLISREAGRRQRRELARPALRQASEADGRKGRGSGRRADADLG